MVIRVNPGGARASVMPPVWDVVPDGKDHALLKAIRFRLDRAEPAPTVAGCGTPAKKNTLLHHRLSQPPRWGGGQKLSLFFRCRACRPFLLLLLRLLWLCLRTRKHRLQRLVDIVWRHRGWPLAIIFSAELANTTISTHAHTDTHTPYRHEENQKLWFCNVYEEMNQKKLPHKKRIFVTLKRVLTLRISLWDVTLLLTAFSIVALVLDRRSNHTKPTYKEWPL